MSIIYILVFVFAIMLCKEVAKFERYAEKLAANDLAGGLFSFLFQNSEESTHLPAKAEMHSFVRRHYYGKEEEWGDAEDEVEKYISWESSRSLCLPGDQHNATRRLPAPAPISTSSSRRGKDGTVHFDPRLKEPLHLDAHLTACVWPSYVPRYLSPQHVSWKPNFDKEPRAGKSRGGAEGRESDSMPGENQGAGRSPGGDVVHRHLVFVLALPNHDLSTFLLRAVQTVAPMFPGVMTIVGNAYEFKDMCEQYGLRSFPKVLFFEQGQLRGHFAFPPMSVRSGDLAPDGAKSGTSASASDGDNMYPETESARERERERDIAIGARAAGYTPEAVAFEYARWSQTLPSSAPLPYLLRRWSGRAGDLVWSNGGRAGGRGGGEYVVTSSKRPRPSRTKSAPATATATTRRVANTDTNTANAAATATATAALRSEAPEMEQRVPNSSRGAERASEEPTVEGLAGGAANPGPDLLASARKAAYDRLSPAQQRWLGGADPTDHFILARMLAAVPDEVRAADEPESSEGLQAKGATMKTASARAGARGEELWSLSMLALRKIRVYVSQVVIHVQRMALFDTLSAFPLSSPISQEYYRVAEKTWLQYAGRSGELAASLHSSSSGPSTGVAREMLVFAASCLFVVARVCCGLVEIAKWIFA